MKKEEGIEKRIKNQTAFHRKRAEKQGADKSIFWLKGFAILLAVILFFTVVSRVAASFTVPQVTVAETGSGKIGHDVTANGMVEAAGEQAVCTLPDLLVAQVSVHAGERVEEGDLLFTVDPEQLEEQITELEGQIAKLGLENEAAKKSLEQEEKKQQIEEQRAKEDYQDAVSRQETSEKKRAENLQEAEAAKQRAGEDLNVAIESKNRAEEAYNQAVKELADAQVQNGSDVGDSGQGRSADDGKENRTDSGLVTDQWKENRTEQSQEALQENVQQKKADLDSCEANVTEKKTAYDTSVEQWKELQDAAGTEEASEKDAIKTATRAVEDAALSESTDNTVQINTITVEQYERQLAKLTALRMQNGEVCADAAGTVTKVFVETGQKTTDTAAVLISDEEKGLLFTASVDNKYREYLSVGTDAELSGSGKRVEECTVSAIETAEDGQTVRITAELIGDSFTPGESAAISVTGKSDAYDCTIPVTAIREENQKTYVLLLDKEDTILGEQYVARQVEVEVLDKNSTYAAVDSSALGSDSQIIVDSNRNVGAGDIVRPESQ